MKVEKMKESRRWLSWLPKAALVALLGAAVVFAGCKSDDDDDDPPNVTEGSDKENPTDKPATGISVSPKTYTLSTAADATAAQKEIELTVTYTPADATLKPSITWSSNNEEVVTLTQNQTDSTKATVKPKGTVTTDTTVTITAKADGLDPATCTITVSPTKGIEVTGVTITPATEQTLTVGDEFALTATVQPGNATNKAVTWHSDNDAVATVTPDANDSTKAKVTAKAAGTAKITATAGGMSSEPVTIKVEAKSADDDEEDGGSEQQPGQIAPADDDSAYPHIFYEKDYEEAKAPDWTTSVPGRYDPMLETVGDNKFLTVTAHDTPLADDNTGTDSAGNPAGQRKNNGATLTGPAFGLPDGYNFKLRFDVKIGGGGNQASSFYVYNSKGQDNANALLSIVQAEGGKNTFKINGADPIEIPGMYQYSSAVGENLLEKLTWYTITVERKDSDTMVAIRETESRAVVFASQKVTASEIGGLSSMVFNTGRQAANFAIDNVVVLTAEDLLGGSGEEGTGEKLYGVDFSSEEDAAKFSDNGNVTKSVEEGNLKLVDKSTGGGNKRSTYSLEDFDLPETGSYTYRVEFDLSMTATSTTAVGRSTGQIALMAVKPDYATGDDYNNGYHVDELNAKYYLASLAHTVTNKGKWYVSDDTFECTKGTDANQTVLSGDTTVEISDGSFNHYCIEVEVEDGTATAVYLTITKKIGGASVLERTKLAIPEQPGEDFAGTKQTCLNILAPGNTTTLLDNLAVYLVE